MNKKKKYLRSFAIASILMLGTNTFAENLDIEVIPTEATDPNSPILAEVNKFEYDDEKKFIFNGNNTTYTVTENLGDTATGTFTIYAPAAGDTISTIDLNKKSGFNVIKDAIKLNIENVKFTNAKNTTLGGAVIYIGNSNAVVNIKNTIFENNRTTSRGGAIKMAGEPSDETSDGSYYVGGTLNLENVDFIANHANDRAGALRVAGGATKITGGSFVGNYANSFGGAIATPGGVEALYPYTLEVDGTLFENNYVTGDAGGAISLGNNATIYFKNAVFKNNHAKNTGGAIRNDYSDLTIENSLFEGNYVSGTNTVQGGAIIDVPNSANSTNGQLIIKDTIFKENYVNTSATNSQGGAIYLSGGGYGKGVQILGTLDSENNYTTQFIENEAKQGGAIYVNNATTATYIDPSGDTKYYKGVVIDGVDFTNNIATDKGGALYINNSGKSGVYINNAVFSNNSAKEGGAIYLYAIGTKRLYIDNTIFSNNGSGVDDITTNGSALYVNSSGRMEIGQNVLFQGNTGSSYIYNDGIVVFCTDKDNETILDNGTGAKIINNKEIYFKNVSENGKYDEPVIYNGTITFDIEDDITTTKPSTTAIIGIQNKSTSADDKIIVNLLSSIDKQIIRLEGSNNTNASVTVLNVTNNPLTNESMSFNDIDVTISKGTFNLTDRNITGSSLLDIADGSNAIMNVMHDKVKEMEISSSIQGNGKINFIGDNSGETLVTLGGTTFSNFKGTVKLTQKEHVKLTRNKFFAKGAKINVIENSIFDYVYDGDGSSLILDNENFIDYGVSVDNGTFSITGKGQNDIAFFISTLWLKKVENSSSLIFKDASCILNSDFRAKVSNSTLTFENANVSVGEDIPFTQIETPASTPENPVYANKYDFSGKNNTFSVVNSTFDMSKQSDINTQTVAGDIYVFDTLNMTNSNLGLDVNLLLDQANSRFPYGDKILANSGSGTVVEIIKLFITDDNGKFLRDDSGNIIYVNGMPTKGKIQIFTGGNTLKIKDTNNVEVLTWATNLYKYGVRSAQTDREADSIEILGKGNSSNDTLRDMNMYTSVYGRHTRGFNFIPTDAEGHYENSYNIYRDLDTTTEGNFTVIGSIYDEAGSPLSGTKSILDGKLEDLRIINEDIGTRLQRTGEGKFVYYEQDLVSYSDITDFITFYDDSGNIVEKSTVTTKDDFAYAIINKTAFAPSSQENGSFFELVGTNEINLDIENVQIQNAKRYETFTYSNNTIVKTDGSGNILEENPIVLDTIKDGSVIYSNNPNAKISLSNTDLLNNEVKAGMGGAIANILSNSLNIKDALIKGNSATGNGGAIYNISSGDVILENITADGNVSGEKGGAIYTSGDMVITNSDFGTNELNYHAYDTVNSTKEQNDIYIDTDATVSFITNENETNYIKSGLAGDGNFVKEGLGTLELSGKNDEFSGETSISAGLVRYVADDNNDSFLAGSTKIYEDAVLELNIAEGISGQLFENISSVSTSISSEGSTGEGESSGESYTPSPALIKKTGVGSIQLAGDNSGFLGKLEIEKGSIDFTKTDASKYISGNTVIDSGANLNYATSVEDTLKNVSGSGYVNKLGLLELTFNIADNISFSGVVNIKEGQLNTTGVSTNDFDFEINIHNQGILNYIAAENSTLTIGDNNSKIVFDDSATGAEAIFNGNSTTYTLDIMSNVLNNIVTINNADIKFARTSYDTGSYNFKNSMIDLTNDSVLNNITFSNLTADNTKLKIDLIFDTINGITSDKLVTTNGTGKLILSSINFLNIEDDGSASTISANVLGGGLSFDENNSLEAFATDVYTYDVNAQGQNVTFTHIKASDNNSLKEMNQYKLGEADSSIRQFVFTDNDSPIYEIGSNLGTTNSGTFTVEGTGSTVVSGAGQYSMFEVTKDYTDLGISDLTLNNANGYKGSALNINNATSKISLTNVSLTNNTSTDNGGAINIEAAQSVTITNGNISGNSSGGLGGAIYTTSNITIENTNFSNNTDLNGANDIYIAEETLVKYIATNTSSISSGLAGSGDFEKIGEEKLNLSGVNENFTGNFKITEGNVEYIQTSETDSYLGGKTEIAEATSLVINNELSNVSANGFLGNGSIYKEGSKALILTSDNSEYTGVLTIKEGAVEINVDTSKYISGNTIIETDGTLSIQNDEETSLSKISGTGSLEKSGLGKLELQGDISNFTGNINVQGGELALAENSIIGNFASGSFADGTTLNLQNTLAVKDLEGNWTTSPNPASIQNINFNTLNLDGDVNLLIDIDLANNIADTITAEEITGNGHLLLGSKSLNVVSDTLLQNASVRIANSKAASKNVIILQDSAKTVMGPIQKYDVTYGNGLLGFSRQGGNTPTPHQVNLAIMASPVATQIGGYLTQLQTLQDGFFHLNSYSKYARNIRYMAQKLNTYAINEPTLFYNKSDIPLTSRSMWVKPYTTFEKVNLKGGIGVSNVAYGSLYGGDSNLIDLGHGFSGVLSTFIGYNGAHQTYNKVSINQQGGTLGLTGTLYRENFFTGLTVSAGASAGEAFTSFGTDHFAMVTAGIANKTGYNFEIKNGQFIVQPSLFLGYTFVNTFNYKNAAGVKIGSNLLNAIQIAPGVKFIGNLRNNWQPYAEVDMIWNIIDKTNVMANDVRLPQLSVKPYVQYGLGLQKSFGENFTSYFQTMIRNGGRNGIVLTGGFRWVLGKTQKNTVQKENIKISNKINTGNQEYQKAKVIKKLSKK